MTDVDAALLQQIFDIAERKREPNIERRRQADDLGARLEIPKWAAFPQVRTLQNRPAPLTAVCSDGTPEGADRVHKKKKEGIGRETRRQPGKEAPGAHRKTDPPEAARRD